jgi:hypothetical protein
MGSIAKTCKIAIIMCEIVANNLAKNGTITVQLSGSNLQTLYQICTVILGKINNQIPSAVAAENSDEYNHLIKMNKSMLLVSMDSLACSLKNRRNYYQNKGTLLNHKDKKVIINQSELFAYYWFNFYYNNSFDAPTNNLFRFLMEFANDKLIPSKQVILETELPTIEI